MDFGKILHTKERKEKGMHSASGTVKYWKSSISIDMWDIRMKISDSAKSV